MRRNSARITVGGQPVRWLGANFWSRAGGPLMWRSYDPAVVREELRVLRAHGLTMTRSFFYWPDFMPEPDTIDEKMTARFADFLDRHADQDMSTVPTFIVGHMSGQNWDPPWRAGRDLYSDVWMVGRQAWFAGEMVRRFGAHPAVAGWLVSNEMPLYGGDQSPPETVAAWAQIMRDAVRAAGGRQPFSLGDGAWGIEATGRENGFRLADAASICDFVGPHVYPAGDDRIRQPTGAVLERLAAGGACVYASYSPGDSAWHRGPSYGRLNETFGIRHQLDVGLTNPVEDDVVRFRLSRDFGGLASGTTLSFAAAGDRHGRGFLPAEPAAGPGAAEVLATDAHGRPALLLRRTGRGSLVLCTYPVEHMAALTPRVNPDDTVTLYDALARHAGVRRLITADDPRVACDTLIRDDGALFAVLASHAAEQLAIKPALPGGGELTSLGGKETAEGVELGPFGITVLSVTGSAAQAKPRPI